MAVKSSTANRAQLTRTMNSPYTWPTQPGSFFNTADRKNRSRTIIAKKYRPHSKKFQLAPCHRPVQAHTTNRLNTSRAGFTRLPPKGIYRYSRNQLPKEMCHRRQNSVADLAR